MCSYHWHREIIARVVEPRGEYGFMVEVYAFMVWLYGLMVGNSEQRHDRMGSC